MRSLAWLGLLTVLGTAMPLLASEPGPYCDEQVEFADASSIDPGALTLALDALKRGKPDCAACILNSQLDSQLEKATRLRDTIDTVYIQKILESKIKLAHDYRERNPWSDIACQGVCKY